MRWLVTTKTHDDPSEFTRALAERGVEVAPDMKPTPLDSGEEVYLLEGSENLERIVKDIPTVVRVNPASKLKFFGV